MLFKSFYLVQELLKCGKTFTEHNDVLDELRKIHRLWQYEIEPGLQKRSVPGSPLRIDGL
jgi:hypothetical protein